LAANRAPQKKDETKMRSSMIRFLLIGAFLFQGSASLCAQSDKAASGLGKTKLREQLQETGKIADFWIYDDLDLGFAHAKNTGKPLLVVFR
jgi:hypothetical protein